MNPGRCRSSCHTENGASVRLDTSEDTRRRELELDKGVRQGVVRLGFWLLTDEVSQVALVADQLLLLVMVDVCADFVKEAGVVGDDQTGDLSVRLEVLSEPGNVGNIQVVSRFVEKEDIGTHKHGAGQGQLHLPSTRQRANLVGLPALGASSEADLFQNLRDTLPALVGEAWVLDNVLKNGYVGVLALVVLNEACLDLILGRETFELAAGDTAHERGLSSTVATAETVAVTLQQSQVGVREEQHTTVAQGEDSIDNLNLAVVFLDRLAELAVVLFDVIAVHSLGDLVSLSGVHQRLQVGPHERRNALELALVDNLGDQLGDVILGDGPDLGVAGEVQQLASSLEFLLQDLLDV
jgi:hypothetical protein